MIFLFTFVATKENKIIVFASVRTNVIKLRIIENERSKRMLIFVYWGLTKNEKCAARFRCIKDFEMRKRALVMKDVLHPISPQGGALWQATHLS